MRLHRLTQLTEKIMVEHSEKWGIDEFTSNWKRGGENSSFYLV